MIRRRIFLDAGNDWPDEWLAVIVQCSTGIVYMNECDGVAHAVRELEGYLVPVAGDKYDEGVIRVGELTAVFHRAEEWGGGVGRELDIERLAMVVRAIPFWTFETSARESKRSRLELDRTHLADVVQGWIPVTTPDGPGALVWKNYSA